MKHELSENKKHVIKFKKHNLFPGSDDNEHNKKSYSSIVDDMRSETTYEDQSMNDSRTKNIPEKPKAKRKQKLEGSKGEKR